MEQVRTRMQTETVDKNTGYILNDLLDVVEELTKIVRDLNPGANYDFMLVRTEKALNGALQELERT